MIGVLYVFIVGLVNWDVPRIAILDTETLKELVLKLFRKLGNKLFRILIELYHILLMK